MFRDSIDVFFCISDGANCWYRLGSGQTLAESHIPFRHVNAIFVSLVEFACGADLVLGLLTPLYALLLLVNMIVAIATNWTHSIQTSGLLAWFDDFLYLPGVLHVLILVWLIFSGLGRYSIDGLIARQAGVAP